MNPLIALSAMDMLQRRWNGNDGMLAGLDALMGALGVTISMDKTIYRPGEHPTYRISGGVPRGRVAWTSFRNGVNTGEFQADYPGDDLNDAGTLIIQGGAFTASDIGDWEKQILIVPEDYAGDYSTLATGQVFFTVSAAGATATPVTPGATGGTATPAKSTSFLDAKVTLPGLGAVPVVAVAGVGLALVLLMGKK